MSGLVGHEARSGRRLCGWLLAVVLATCAWPLADGAASALALRTSVPPGAVKLPASSVRHLSSGGRRFACGKVNGQWLSGNVLSESYFITNRRRAADFARRATAAKPTLRRQYRQQAGRYRALARVRDPLCHGRVTLINPHARTGSVGDRPDLQLRATDSDGGALRYTASGLPAGLLINRSAGTITGTFTAAGPTSVTITATDLLSGARATVRFGWWVLQPVRFRLSNAVGLVLTARTSAARDRSTSRSQAARELSSVGLSGLEAVTADGQLVDALDAPGSVVVSNFLIAPNNLLYVVFQQPVDLATSEPESPGGCLLAQVDPTTGVPTCIDDSLSSIDWTTTPSPGRTPIQFDSSGAIYYEGVTTAGLAVLRKYSDGTTTDLITADDDLVEFLVLPDGTVIVSGRTVPTDLPWTRSISPTGRVRNLTTADSEFLAMFPDGNAYIGTSTNGTDWRDPGVVRYITATHEMDPIYWIAQPTDATQDYFSSNQLCANPDRLQLLDFCIVNGAWLRWAFSSTSGGEYVDANADGTGTFMQYYPTVSFLPTEVTDVTAALGFANDVLLAGTTAAGTNVLTLYDTTSNTEQELLGADDQVEIYHLSFDAATDTVLFDGLRLSDNQYVIGEYDLGKGQANIVASSSENWTDAQAFGQ
jgi:hypothetical protein